MTRKEKIKKLMKKHDCVSIVIKPNSVEKDYLKSLIKWERESKKLHETLG
jgi:lipid II:glycine glycyltransferase (peptidoglycan interpeptide bridge formation enzyme)